MSQRADIDHVFNELCLAMPEKSGQLRTAHFEVFESLGWDDSAKEIVIFMLENGLESLFGHITPCSVARGDINRKHDAG